MDAREQQLWELSQGLADTTEGTVVTIDWAASLVEVNVAGITQRMPWFGPAPWKNDRVRIISAAGKPIAALIQGSATGTVVSTGAGVANVTGEDGKSYSYPYLGTAPGNGTIVRLDHAGRVVLGVYSSTPAGSSLVPIPPPPPPSAGSGWFTPAWSGNWSSGAFQNDFVTISSTRVGAYGYGTSIADTIPDGATITVAQLHLAENWDEFPSEVIGFGTHNSDGRPGSMTNGSLSGVYTSPALVIDIRGTVGDSLKTGSAKGIGFYSSSAGPYGWREFDRAPNSGRIYMEWSV